MSGLILCNQKKVKHPLYIEELGIHIFSGEELCYVIFHHLFLIKDSLVNEKLMEFIGDGLDYRDLVKRLYPKQKDARRTDEVLLDILKEIPYFSTSELNQFKDRLGKLRNMHPAQLLLEKADYYAERKRYGIAIKFFEEILESYGKQLADGKFLGNVWNRLAGAYANLFEFQKAAAAYEHAYGYIKGNEALKKLYFLTLIREDVLVSEDIMKQIGPDERIKWGEELDDVRMEAVTGDKTTQLNHLFQKDDDVRKEEVDRHFYGWKEEYRSMC